MSKGFVQLRNLVFITIFIVIAFSVGYFYFFSSSHGIVEDVVAANINQKAQIKFTHPVYQYSLYLPYSWKGNYQVIESENQTNFIYYDETGNTDLLFSIKRQSAEQLVGSAGESKRLGELDGYLYILTAPERISESLSGTNSKMRREVFSIADTFSFMDNNRVNVEILKILSSHQPSGKATSSVVFSGFEIIASQENSSSTEYYIWFYRRQFTWDEGFLRDWVIESQPGVIVISKIDRSTSMKVPRRGVNLNSDIKKIFPESVWRSEIFKETTIEHGIMIDKLSSRLADAISLYFGSEPVITRAGFIRDLKPGDGGMYINLFLAGSIGLSASSTYVISDMDKTVTTFFISSSTPDLLLPSTSIMDKFGKEISSSSPRLIALVEWPSVFNKKSSVWIKKPFWFEILDGKILRVSSVSRE